MTTEDKLKRAIAMLHDTALRLGIIETLVDACGTYEGTLAHRAARDAGYLIGHLLDELDPDDWPPAQGAEARQ